MRLYWLNPNGTTTKEPAMTTTLIKDPTDAMLDTLRAMRTRYGTKLAATYVDNADLMVVEHASLNIRMSIDAAGNAEADNVWSFRARRFVPGEDL
jgi:hypothetical protein